MEYMVKLDVMKMYKSTTDEIYQKTFTKCDKPITCAECAEQANGK